MVEVAKPITHPELVRNLVKPGRDIAEHLNANPTDQDVLLVNAKLTIDQTSNLDRAKKQAIYAKPIGLKLFTDDPDHFDKYIANTVLSGAECDLIHMASGIAGEAGEVLEVIYNHVTRGGSIDKQKLIEELGDLEFYMEGLRQHYGITRENVLSNNIAKLGTRYSSGTYSDAQAQNRADKIGD